MPSFSPRWREATVVASACIALAISLLGASVPSGSSIPAALAIGSESALLPHHASVVSQGPRSSAAPTMLPLGFELNEGQVDRRVRYLTHGNGAALYLTATDAVVAVGIPRAQSSSPRLLLSAGTTRATRPRRLIVDKATLRLHLLGANPHPHVVGLSRLPGIVNYFIGNDPRRWHTNIPTYAQVAYRSVYPGIDLVYHGTQGHLEYDFVLRPGASPRSIRLGLDGTGTLRLDRQGNLVLQGRVAEIRQQRPIVYQEEQGVKRVISAEFVPHGAHQVGFKVGAYDARRPLIIDPVMIYSTYLGGSGTDRSNNAIAVDTVGSAYVAGWTNSPNFPTANAVQIGYAGGLNFGDAFITKLNPEGTAFVYSTYLGGTDDDRGLGIAVDNLGNAYVTGETYSHNFPTVHAFQGTNGGGGVRDAFVAKLNASGNALIYSTYLGGSGDDEGTAIAVDSGGNAYVTGFTGSSNFPTANPLQATKGGGIDAFVAKLNPSGDALVYSTYLGGSSDDDGGAIALDSAGSAYVTGWTYSTDFPRANALQSSFGGVRDAFVAKLNPSGSALVYSTYLGGSADDYGTSIAVDGAGNAYVAGATGSGNLPTVGAVQSSYGGGNLDAFIAKLNAAGSALVYSTYLGGSGEDVASGIAVDSVGNAYVVGGTASVDFPRVNALQGVAGGRDAFVAKLNPSGSALVYSTYLGGSSDDFGLGIAVDSAGNAYVTGATGSTDFPTAHAPQGTLGGGQYDAFITKIGYIHFNTPVPTATPTATVTPTGTPTPTPVPTDTPTATPTTTPLPTYTPVPTTTPTGTPTATPVPTATATPVPTATRRPKPTPTTTMLPLTISLKQRNVRAGGTLMVRIRTAPHAYVSVILVVARTRTWITHANSKHKSIRHTVTLYRVLYRILRHGTADGRGQVIERLRITYRPARRVQALITVRAYTRWRTTWRTATVTIQR